MPQSLPQLHLDSLPEIRDIRDIEPTSLRNLHHLLLRSPLSVIAAPVETLVVLEFTGPDDLFAFRFLLHESKRQSYRHLEILDFCGFTLVLRASDSETSTSNLSCCRKRAYHLFSCRTFRRSLPKFEMATSRDHQFSCK